MKLRFCLVWLFLPFFLHAQTPASYTVFLVGDAGEDTIPGKALLMLKEELIANPNSTVLFLGDNVYPSGLKLGNKNSEARLLSQLQILKNYKGNVYFIPGNHDWDAQKRKGISVLADQQKFVEDYLKQQSSVTNKDQKTFLPENGLPGPETVLLDNKLRLVMMDTQWFLHAYKKNKIGSKKNTKELFYKRLDSIVAYSKANGEELLVAAHHPMYTNGEHSRSAQPLRFLVNYTPLQLFGLLGLNRLFSQDIVQPRYKKMRKRMLGSFNTYDHIVYASGHDHNLQCFKENGNRYIVSGCGSKLSKLRKHKRFISVFEDDKTIGYVKLVYTNGILKTYICRAGQAEVLLEGY